MDIPPNLVSRVTGARHFGLYWSSLALMGTTAINAALGMVFWFVAARLLPTEVVGAGAGGISAAQLVSIVGWVGLQSTLIRYVPSAGTRRPRLVLTIYGIGIGGALGFAVVFLISFASPFKVGFLTSSPLSIAAFLFGVAFLVISSLQDAVLVGIRKPLLVPFESFGFGTLKLGLLIAFVATPTSWTLLGVWLAATAILVLVVSILLLRVVPNPSMPRLPSRRVLLRFSVGHSVVGVAGLVPDFLVPLMVLAMLGGVANAHYFGAWTLAVAARLLVANMATALTVEAASGVDSFGRLGRSTMRLATWVLTPTIVVLLLGAEPILRVFGPTYAEAAPLLRLLSLSIAPSAIVAYAVAVDRDRERFAAALVITVTGTAVALALDLVLIPVVGVTGAGVGWLCGQTIAAFIAIATMGRARRTRTPSDSFSRPGVERPADDSLACTVAPGPFPPIDGQI